MFRKYFSTLNFYSKRLLSWKNPNKFDWAKQEKILMEPFEHIQRAPSKFHAWMAPAFNHWLQIPEEKIDIIQKAMQIFMTWTILLDDIQDNSDIRYGVPAAHKVFGVGLSINASIKAHLLGQQLLTDLGHPLALKILVEVYEEFFLGQGTDIYWRDNFLCPTEEEHFEMVKKKCGSWFNLPVALMQLFSNNKQNYVGLATDIGMYYHMIDDYYNLFQPKALEQLATIKRYNHTSCNDITECKLTLAIIHAMQFPDVASELADILKQRTSDPKLHDRAISLLKKHGSDEYTRDTLKSFEADIRTEITQLGGNAALTAFMDDLSFQV